MVPMASTSPFITASMPANKAMPSDADEESLDGDLIGAGHAPALAAQAAASRGWAGALAACGESISSGGSVGAQAFGERPANNQDEQQLGHGATLRAKW